MNSSIFERKNFSFGRVYIILSFLSAISPGGIYCIFEGIGLMKGKKWGLYLMYIYQYFNLIVGTITLMGLAALTFFYGYADIFNAFSSVLLTWILLGLAVINVFWRGLVIDYFRKRKEWFA